MKDYGLFIGIDNGYSGAIVMVDDLGHVYIHPMPTVTYELKTKSAKTGKPKHKTEYVLPVIVEIFKNHANENPTVMLERAQAMPSQGVVSMFSTGEGYGIMKGMLAALGVPFLTVRPQEWQKEFGIGGDPREAYLRAAQVFPREAAHLVTARGAMRTGVADALLIAEYCRRKAAGG